MSHSPTKSSVTSERKEVKKKQQKLYKLKWI